MVLENATDTADSFSSEPPPTSDLDPYSGSYASPSSSSNSMAFQPSPGSETITIDLSKLPTRVSLLGPVAHHPQTLTEGISAQCRFASNLLQRPLKQEEADAFAFHYASSLRKASYGGPIGVTLGFIQAFRGRAEYRFPLWKPTPQDKGGWFNPEKFFAFRGQMARMSWQLLRLNVYGAVGMSLASVFFGSYALTTSLAGRTMDPRLKDFNAEMARKVKEQGRENVTAEMKGEARGRGGLSKDVPEGQETYEMARQRRSVSARSRPTQDTGDDMSPSGGYNMAEYQEPSMADQSTRGQTGFGQRDMRGGHSSDTDLMSDSQSQKRDTDQRSSTRTSPQQSQSPSQSPSQAPAGSWARIRADAASSSQQASANPRQGTTPSTRGSWKPPQSEQKQGSTVGDAFSFSESDEEKQFARGEAQKDFDRRMDREREGKDFEDAGQGKRWR